jgi:protoporphyrinogen oxidase
MMVTASLQTWVVIMDRFGSVVLGGGPTGLSAAMHAGADSLLLERHATVGGSCRSNVEEGFTFDLGSKIIASDDPYVFWLYGQLLGANQHWQRCETSLYRDGAYSALPQAAQPANRFGYPLHGGLQALMDSFLPRIAGRIELDAEAVRLLPSEHVIVLADGRRFSYRHLISTIPLPDLVRIAGSAAPDEIQAAANALHHRSTRQVNIGVDRAHVSSKLWIYYPENTVFQRIFAQGNASSACSPPGGFGFSCEVIYSGAQPLPLQGDALIERCVDDARQVDFLQASDRVLVASQHDLPVTYPLDDADHTEHVARIRQWLWQHDILLAGELSEWNCDSADHAFVAGRRAARLAARLRGAAQGQAPGKH